MNIKLKFVRRLLCLVLALVMIFGAVGCGSTAKAAISFGDVVINENIYCYWMSKYKAMYLYSMFGLTEDNADLWQYEYAEGISFGAFIGAMIVQNLMSNAVMLGLFDEYGLELTVEEQNSIDSAIQQLQANAGSKSALNSALAAYGINADMLRDVYIMEAKISAVQNHLYGEGGIYAASSDEVETYFSENYYRMKHILIRTDVKYERDEDGLPIVDEETQSYKTIELTADEIEAQKALAADLEKRIAAGEDFDKLVIEYSEDTGMEHFEDGYYITSATTFLPTEIISAVPSMKVGEVKIIEHSYGISLTKRYDLKKGAYNEEPYKSELIGDLASTVNTVKMQELVNSYMGSVVYDEDIISTYTISVCTPNFYY